jgi:hypothetical protein
MVQNTTIETSIDKETENYAVYESADGDTIVGAYVSESAAEQVGEFASVTLAESGEGGLTLEKGKDTKSYGYYKSQGNPAAVNGIYISHEVLESEESDDDGPTAPDEISMAISSSDEESFEDAVPSQDEEESELVESGDDSDDEDDDPSQEEEVADLVSDDELGIAE